MSEIPQADFQLSRAYTEADSDQKESERDLAYQLQEGASTEHAEAEREPRSEHAQQGEEILAMPWIPSTSAPLDARSKRSFIVLPDERTAKALINLLIERSGTTQAELARRMGIQPQTLSQYRSLKHKKPSLHYISRLCLASGARLIVEWPDP